ncbi:MAG: hypothetical protein L3J67_02020 [Hyphomicrobiaceae bacterium]|nr:hypothetical protein [Hyphomicrobiaceae bacterium]
MQKKKLILGALVLAALYILVSFGNWQVRRLAWKTELIATIKARTSENPISFFKAMKNCRVDVAQCAYQNVWLRGRFYRHKQKKFDERHFYMLDDQGRPGWHIYSLFEIAYDDDWKKDGRKIWHAHRKIWVNRGFVPLYLKALDKRRQGQIDEQITITGFLRLPQMKGLFTLDNNTEKNEYYYLGPVFSIDLNSPKPSGGWPRPGTTRLNFPNNHLGYIITWYGLALALLGVYGFFLYGQLKKPAEIKPAKEEL